MAAIIEPGVYTLPEPFDFDAIDHSTAKNLGRTLYGDEDILLTADKPVGMQIVSITLWEAYDSQASITLDERYTEKGLAPNPWHLVAFAMMQPDFADKRAIVTQWKDVNDKFCYALFSLWSDGKRRVRVNRAILQVWGNGALFSGSLK